MRHKKTIKAAQPKTPKIKGIAGNPGIA